MPEDQTTEWKAAWHDDHLKVLCGLANAKGGRLLLGYDDTGHALGVCDSKRLLEELPQKTPQILGITPSIQLLPANGFDTLEIRVAASTVPISLRGRYYQRNGSVTKELQGTSLNEFLLHKSGLTWDAVIEDRASFDDIDPAAIKRFLADARKTDRLPDSEMLPIPELLEKLGLAENGRLKRAAIILFGKDPLRFYPGVSVRLGRFLDNDPDLRFHEIIEDNLVNSLPEILERLDRKFFIKTIRFEGLHRYETPPYPREALREAFLNALVHKSYGSGIHIQCRVYDTRLTLWNEGKLPDDLPAEALLRPHASKPRNPLLAAACFKAGYIDAWGRGIEKMTHACESAGLPTPTFESNSGGVLATFTLHPASVEPVASKKNTPQVEAHSRSQAESGAESGAESSLERLLNYLAEKPHSKSEIAFHLGQKGVTGALNRIVKQLFEEGLIERTIPDKPNSRLQKYRLTEKGRKRKSEG
jgi:ATP-dependent DNA helicase RecG